MDSDNTVYIGSNDHRLYAVKEGKKLWDFETGDRVKSSPSLDTHGIVYVGSDDQKLYALKDGKKLWDFDAKGAITTRPAAGADGTIYMSATVSRSPMQTVGKIYALKPPATAMALQEIQGNTHCKDTNASSSIESYEKWLIIDDVRIAVKE